MKGAEIMAVGTWNGTTFTKDDLDSIVSSFNALGLKGRIPLKLGHENDAKMKDGAPALGWVERVWREGNMLLADFASMPQLLFDAVKDGLYRHVSVELLHKVKADTREIPWVLDAVSLLGATQPAVGILKDLQSLTLARRPALQGGARLVFKRVFSNQSEVKSMDEKEVKALIDAAVGAVTVKFSKEIDDVKKVAADQVAAAQAEAAKLKFAAHRSEINARFETAIKADTLEPKHRESFNRMAGVADDARVMAIKLEDVDAFIKDNAKAPSKKFTKATTEGGDAADAEEAKMTWAAEVVAHRTRKLALSRNVKPDDYEARIRISEEIFRADPKLAEAYRVHGPVPSDEAA